MACLWSLYAVILLTATTCASPVLRVLPKPSSLQSVVLSDANKPLLLWHTHNEVLTGVWAKDHADESRLQVVALACPTATVQFIATARGTLYKTRPYVELWFTMCLIFVSQPPPYIGTITVLHDDAPVTVGPLGTRAGTMELLPSDDYPSGIRACTSTSFCVDLFSPAPGELDFAAHADVRQVAAGGLLSMRSLEDWYAVLTDGPPTVSQALALQQQQQALEADATAQPLAALSGMIGGKTMQHQTHIASRRMLLNGARLQRLGRPTVLPTAEEES